MLKDLFGKNASEVLNKKLWLFDMDGTIYKDNFLFPGVIQLLDYIKNNGGEYVFVTNNSSKSVEDYIKKVNCLGIKASRTNFFTSSEATIILLKEKYPGAKVYCQGTRSLIDELKNNGIDTTEEIEDDVDLILVGFDTELTSQKLRNTCEILNRDLPYYATNPDLVCPTYFGFIPDCGSICQILFNATGKKPIYVGKPEATMVDVVRKKFGNSKSETIVIGDRLYTDIAAGLNAGVCSVCVLSGEATINEINKSLFKPDFVFDSVASIITNGVLK